MRRRPTPHAQRKRKRRELLEVIAKKNEAIERLRSQVVPFNCAVPYIEPDRHDIETLTSSEFFVHTHRNGEPHSYHLQEMGILDRCMEIGRELANHRLVEVLMDDQPENLRRRIVVRLRVVKPRQ